MVFVLKRDGRKELFSKKKIIRTCMRAGASRKIAEEIAEEVEKNIYDGIKTSEILKMVLKLLKERIAEKHAIYDLKMSLFRLGPAGYEFEKFVARLLEEYGYRTKTNVILRGFCVSHEIDVIAEKNGEIFMIECKFHNIPGSYTGIKETLYTYARFLDLKDGFRAGMHEYNFSKAWMFTNTRFSQDSKKFARCRGMKLTGWRYVGNESIEKMLERKNLYPITILKTLKKKEEQKLISFGIAFCKDILKKIDFVKKILPENRAEKIRKEACEIIGASV